VSPRHFFERTVKYPFPRAPFHIVGTLNVGAHLTSAHVSCRFFAINEWGLNRPEIILTDTGGALDFDLNSDEKDKILKGMVCESAKTPTFRMIALQMQFCIVYL